MISQELLHVGERHTQLKLGPDMVSRLMYHDCVLVYLNQAAGIYLFLYFSNFHSLKFQNFKFLSLFSVRPTKLKLDRLHRQRVDLLCRPNTSSQFILVLSFFFFSLSL